MKWNIFGGNDEFHQVVKDNDTDKLGNLFEEIIGYEKEKEVTLGILRAKYPIHPLYHGEPGTGKTMFGECMKNHKELKGKVELITGARTSKAGLTDMLIRRGDKIRVLFIDEIEWLSRPDQAVLLTLMSNHEIIVMISGKEKRKQLPNLIIGATCNNPSKLLKPLFDRFFKIKMESYTEQQFIKIARVRLAEYELPYNLIEEIIDVTLEMEGPNMRRAVDVAKLRPHTRDQIISYLEVSK